MTRLMNKYDDNNKYNDERSHLIENESSEKLAEREDLLNEDEEVNKPVDNESIYEHILSVIGFGKFQLFLLFVCGLANASDAIEVLCVSFILPVAECDFNMTTSDKGYLSSITFAGMMIGGYLWGSLSDVFGRKYILIFALFFNSFFAILCGLAQKFSLLLLFRFLSGMGVGGSIPIVWSYFSEFIPKNIRGRMLCCLASSWCFGNLLVIFLAYVILNQTHLNISLFSGFIFINNWRMFMIACSFPSIFTGILIFFLPESPKFYLYSGQEFKAKKVLRYIYSFNHIARTSFDIDRKKTAYENIDELKKFSIVNSNSNNEEINSGYLSEEIHISNNSKFSQFFKILRQSSKIMTEKTIAIFKPPHTFNTIIVLFIMFALCFGYYGLWIWLPELYKRMNKYGGSPCQSNLPMNSSIIIKNSTCKLENEVYLSSFYSAMSNIPGNIFTIIFIDKMGRNLITSASLILSGLSIFGIPFIYSENQGVILTIIFGGINVLTFNSFECTSTELYPTKLRSTSLGVQYVAGRLGAILGNILFGLAVDVSCYIPLLTISGLLILSGILAFKLPESKNMDTN